MKTVKIEKFEKNKKSTRGIALRNICTKLGADLKVFRYKNDDTVTNDQYRVPVAQHTI